MKPAHIVGQTLTRARNAIADRKRAPAQGVMIAPPPHSSEEYYFHTGEGNFFQL